MSENPNIIEVELTLGQIEYLEAWSQKLNGVQVDSLIRLMIDSMMRANPNI